MRWTPLFLASFVFAVGCGDVCDKAQKVTEGCDWYTETEGSDTAGTADEVECSGDTEAAAQCIVDNADAYCEYFGNVLDDPMGDYSDNEYYKNCIAQ